MVHEVRIGEWLILDQTKENSNFLTCTPTDIAFLALQAFQTSPKRGQKLHLS